ncbi:hypothetical protein MFUL124B02_36415 [Myxococcus fulvus 124B02]|nr:hypothetical protein MFUL124B02_36415 [Myxococcus fulvus 124B02]
MACAFPSPSWEKLVFGALDGLFGERNGPWQSARKNIEILLKHFQETGTTRQGANEATLPWVDAAEKEHAAYPFRGIVVRVAEAPKPHWVVAATFGAVEHPIWSCDPGPVTRQAADLANALAPVLRAAKEIRFVDPYFDAGVREFLGPMTAFLGAAQARRTLADLRMSIHVAVEYKELEQAKRIDPTVNTFEMLARRKHQTCREKLKPLLRPGVDMKFYAWREGTDAFHNRYVLSNIGGVLLGTGLDANGRVRTATDDLTILSASQAKARWAKYSTPSPSLKLVLEEVL